MEVRAREEAAEPRVQGGGAHGDPWAGKSCSELSIYSTPGHVLRERGDEGRGAPEGTGEDGLLVERNMEGQRPM